MKELLEAARRVRGNAHAPYSGFAVGCALRDGEGRIFAGTNVENAAYPEGICAEAAAIAAMVAAGGRRIRELLVLGPGDRPCPPCGGCRQKIREFALPGCRIHMAAERGGVETRSLEELLPASFALTPPSREPPEERGLWRLRELAQARAPRIALLLGSGLGEIEGALEDADSVDYAELAGFPTPGVPGHAGRVTVGRLAGVPLLCLAGRLHLYEGRGSHPLHVMVRTLAGLGCRLLVVTNAAGSLHPGIGPGSLVRIADHINFQGSNPLVGLRDPGGPPFLDLGDLYDPELGALLEGAAAAIGLPLPSGTYLATLGPSFETPAEIRAFRVLGADLVGMSLVPEAIAARHAGLRVLAISLVTNLAAGLAPSPLDHRQTLEEGRAAAAKLRALLERALPELAGALAREPG